MSQVTAGIDSVMKELRVFEPPKAGDVGAARWLIDSPAEYEALYKKSIEDPEAFYGEVAKELTWFEPWSKVMEFTPPDATWFIGAKTNLCYNCVDRHVEAGRGDAVGLIWEGEPIDNGVPEIKTYTYAQLKDEVSRFANGLKSLGVKKGDVVTIYMGMVPELAIACLACARIGAVHSVIFGGFASHSIVDRVHDATSAG